MSEVADELLEQPSTELTVQDRAAIALASDKTRKDLIAMAAKFVAITEIKNKAGRDECHSAAMTLAGARIAISKTGKAARDDATKFSKAVIAEEASLIAITEPEEKRLLALRDEWDEVVAAEKAAREAAERARITAIHQRIAAIREYVALAAGCRTSARVDDLLTKLSLISLADFEEFGDEAAAAHLDSMERVTAILAEKTEQEAEQARIKEEQAAAAAKLADERAELERQRETQAQAEREATAAREAAEAQARAQREAEAAELQRQRDAFAAEQAAARAAQQAEADRLAEQAAELERVAQAQRDAASLAAQAEQTQIDQAAATAQAAIDAAREAESIPAELLDQLSETVTFIATPEPWVYEPSDADVMWIAISAVSKEYGWTTEQATTRLQEVQWTL